MDIPQRMRHKSDMQTTKSNQAGERTQIDEAIQNTWGKSFLLRNKVTKLFYSVIGSAAAFSESDPTNAELVSASDISQIELVWDKTNLEAVVAPVRIVIETSPGYYMHQNMKRQTVSPDFARTYSTQSGAAKAVGKARKVWPNAGIAMIDGNFNPII